MTKDDARTQFLIVVAMSIAFLFLGQLGTSYWMAVYDKLIMWLLGAGFLVSWDGWRKA